MENEEDYAVGLLRRLDAEPGTPSRVDLYRAMAEGNRRRRTRRLAGAGSSVGLVVAVLAVAPVALAALRPGSDAPERVIGAASAAASVTPAATAPTNCSVQSLPGLASSYMSTVTGADPTGRLILGRSYLDGTSSSQPVLIWDNGVPTKVAIPGTEQELNDITSAGVAVGWGMRPGGPAPYAYQNGKTVPLPGVRYGTAQAINEAGQIAGDGAQSPKTTAVLWRGSTAQPIELPLPGPQWSGHSVDIDSDGTVVGVVWDGKHALGGSVGLDQRTLYPGNRSPTSPQALTGTGYLWLPDGTARELPKPTINGVPAESFIPQSIRNGWVTGLAVTREVKGKPITHPARLYVPTGTFADLPATSFTTMNGNGQGWIVGYTPDRGAGLLTGAGLLPLPSLKTGDSGAMFSALTLSDDGRTIAGQGMGSKGVAQAVVWHCR